MNSNFTERQIAVYANALTEGDIVWCVDNWFKIYHQKNALTNNSRNPYNIKNIFNETVTRGFYAEYTNFPYKLITLKDYKLQGGEKLIWLGHSSSLLTFGREYIATKSLQGIYVIFNDKGIEQNIDTVSTWGVIPNNSHLLHFSKQESAHNEILSQFESRIHNITDYLHYEIANSSKHKAKMLFESILQNGFNDIVAQIAQDSTKLSSIVCNESDTEYTQLYKMSNQIQQILESLILLDAVVEEKIQLHEQGD